jgi:endo-1,4-beta-xylanase
MNRALVSAALAAAVLAGAAALSAEEAVPSLKDSLGGAFAIGAAVPPTFVEPGDRHAGLLERQFNALVAENAMKPENLQRVEGRFKWTQADAIVDFAAKRGMALRGHTLVWHQQTSPWFFADREDRAKPASKELLLERLKTHISAVVGRYKGRVRAWDVVNEVLTDDGRLRDGASGSKWYAICGADYIDAAFRWAREADPAAQLVINDYSLESSVAKRDGMYELVKGMLARGVPVDAVGMQMHVSIYGPSVAEVRAAIDKFASLGLKVQVTELDVSLYGWMEKAKPLGPELFAKQAERYAELFGLFREEAAKGNLDMVMLWGVSDEQSWLNDFPIPGRGDAPLLFDGAQKPKPAFWAILGKKG